jgi:hypothetical protein
MLPYYPKQGMETGEKPALLFPIGRRIVSHMAWKEQETPVLIMHSLEHPSGFLHYSVYF